jgi:hypothetical protein
VDGESPPWLAAKATDPPSTEASASGAANASIARFESPFKLLLLLRDDYGPL